MRLIVVADRDLHPILTHLTDAWASAGHDVALWDDLKFATYRSEVADAFVLGVWQSNFARLAAKLVPVRFHHNGFTGGTFRRMGLISPIDDIVDREKNIAKIERRLRDAREHCETKAALLAGTSDEARGVVLARDWLKRVDAMVAARGRAYVRSDQRYLAQQITLAVVFFLIRSFDDWIQQPGATPAPAPERSGASQPPAERDGEDKYVTYTPPTARHIATDAPAINRTATPMAGTHRDRLARDADLAARELSTAEERVRAREALLGRTPVGAPERPARERELEAAQRMRRAAATRANSLKKQIDGS